MREMCYLWDMQRPEHTAFYEEVYEMVAQIPPGKVLTYGDIAALTGFPAHSRMVGRAMREAPDGRGLPCHRVVNAGGRLAPGWVEQRTRLQEEGVAFRQNGMVHMKRCRWEIDKPEAENSTIL